MKQESLRENLKEVSKIHFLIHPGYLSNDLRNIIKHDGIEYLDRIKNRFPESADYDISKADSLLQTYESQAKKMGQNEIMLIITPTYKKEYRQDLNIRSERLYMQRIKKIKKILGDRLIILSNDTNIASRKPKPTFDTFERIANARGFTIPKNIHSEAYGELLGLCVDVAAQNLNTEGKLEKHTEIQPNLTNGKYINDVKSRPHPNNDRIKYKNN